MFGCGSSLKKHLLRRELRASCAVGGLRFLFFCLFFSCFLSLPAWAEINDEAFLFSATTTQKANRILQEIEQSTSPSTEVALRTIPSLPSNDADGKAVAERLYREQRIRGLLIVVVKQPSQLILTGNKSTLAKLPKSEEMRSNMLAEFRAERYDNGLIQGLRSLQDELQKAFPGTIASELKGQRLKTGAEAASDRLAERMARVFGVKDEKAKRALPEEPKVDPSTQSHPRIGFEIGNWFFVLMFSVLAWMMFPWSWVGGKSHALAVGRQKLKGLTTRLGRGRVAQNLRGAGPGPATQRPRKGPGNPR